MKPLILDATPLIYLTKAGLSRLFEELNREKYTSPKVKIEVLNEGKRKGVPDANVLEIMFREDVFNVKQPSDEIFLKQLLETRGLHEADAEVIALASELEGTAILDDEAARKTAKIYGVSYAGTPYILMLSIGQDLITRERARQAIGDMIASGWRCSIETYTKIMDVLEK